MSAIYPGGGGGGELSAHILEGMCHSKVKNGGLRSGSSVKMRGSGAGSSVKLGVSGSDCRTRLAGTLAGCNGLAAVNRPWAATERLEGKETLKMMVSGAAKTLKWRCSEADFFVICQNDMLWSGN